MKNFFRGAATALITPFEGRNGARGVNYSCLKQLLTRQFAAGVSAVVILGTTGESATVTEKERREIFKFCVQTRNSFYGDSCGNSCGEACGDRRTKLIFGCGANDTRTAEKRAAAAQKLGADGVLAVTPYYNKCTQRGIYFYYREICAACDLPVIAYNVPTRTGVNILPETMARIAELPQIAGLKDAGGNMAQSLEILRLIGDRCDLYSGADELNLPILLCGGVGAISVTANVAPRAVQAMCEAVGSGDYARAIRINDLLATLNEALFCEVNPIPVKAAMNLLGFFCGKPRAPLTELENGHLQTLAAAISRFAAAAKNEPFCKDGEL